MHHDLRVKPANVSSSSFQAAKVVPKVDIKRAGSSQPPYAAEIVPRADLGEETSRGWGRNSLPYRHFTTPLCIFLPPPYLPVVCIHTIHLQCQ